MYITCFARTKQESESKMHKRPSLITVQDNCTDKELRDLFRVFDPKETGYIDLPLFEQLLQSIG